MKRFDRARGDGVLVALCSLLFLAWSARFLARASIRGLDGNRYFALFDDALVSMRYAWNFSHGHGLVWNAGERVEGYSNLLTTLLMSVATALLDRRLAPLAIQLAGVATVLTAAALVHRLARYAAANDAEPVRQALPAIALISTLAYYPLAYWSFMGMETGLLTVLFLASLVAVESWAARGGRAALAVVPLSLGLAALARPDGVLIALLVIPVFAHAAATRLGTTGVRATTLGVGLTTMAFPLAQTVFRLAYYGAALPNTYVLKIMGIPMGVRLANGLAFLAPLLWPGVVLALTALIGLRLRPDRPGGAAFAAIVLLAGYQVAVGGDPWPYWRILTPAVPLALIAFARVALRALADGSWAAATPRRLRVAIAGVAVAVMVGWLDQPFLPEITMARRAYQYEANRDNVNVALAIDSLTTAAASVGVFWAGGIPYYTMRSALDFLGKSDPHVARLAPDLSGRVAWAGMYTVPGHNKYDLGWSIARLRPTYVQGFAWGRQDLSAWARAHYDSVTFAGVGLHLLRGSPAVRWERLPRSARTETCVDVAEGDRISP